MRERTFSSLISGVFAELLRSVEVVVIFSNFIAAH